jgi:hypothetical protein
MVVENMYRIRFLFQKIKHFFKVRRKKNHLTLIWDFDHVKPKINVCYEDVWNMDSTLSVIIVALLKQLRDRHVGYPAHYDSDEQYIAELNQVIADFEYLNDMDTWSEEYPVYIDKCYGWLKDHIMMLWD